jgi:translocation and assembly module TamB
MNKLTTGKVIRKIFKILMWIVISITSLLLLLIIAIRIPSVQNFVVKKATGIISDKTKTRVEVGYIKISFPKTIVLENIFLDDMSKDTLFFAEKLKIDIDMFGLLQNRLTINNISINNLYTHIYRTRKDTVYNFSFISKAFNPDTSASEQHPDTTAKPLEIAIGTISLQSIRCSFQDEIGGIALYAFIGNFNTEFESFDLINNKYKAEDIKLENSSLRLSTIEVVKEKDTAESKFPDINFEKLELNNITAGINDITAGKEMLLNIGALILSADNINLPEQSINLDEIAVNNTSFIQSVKYAPEKKEEQFSKSKPWSLTSDKIKLSEIQLKTDNNFIAAVENSFDANHLDLKINTADLNDFNFSDELISGNLAELQANESGKFYLSHAEVEFSYGKGNIMIENLDVTTTKSDIHASLKATLPTDQSGKLIVAGINLDGNLKNSRISSRDIIYFQPLLRKKNFFSGNDKIVFINARFNGIMADLRIPTLEIRSGNNTKIKAALAIKGLPDAANANYQIDMPVFETGAADVNTFLPGVIPANIHLPVNISSSIKFKGSQKKFNTGIIINTSDGNLMAIVNTTGSDERFMGSFNALDLNMGKILGDTSTFGKLTMNTDFNGKGLKKETATAEVKLKVESVEIKKYSYKNFNLDGKLSNNTFEGNAELNDTNASFKFNGIVAMTGDSSSYKFNFDLGGIDLKATNLSTEDVRISAKAEADLTGNNFDNMNGKAGLTDLLIIKDGNSYQVDSVLFASINEKTGSSFSFSSAIISADFKGTISPGKLVPVLQAWVNKYFFLSDSIMADTVSQNFTFNIQVKNHPVLRNILLPGLEEFSTLKIAGKFDSRENILSIDGDIPKIRYAGTMIDSAHLTLLSDQNKINYSFTIRELSNPAIKFVNTTLHGNIHDNRALINLAIRDTQDVKKIALKSYVESFTLGYKRFVISDSGLVLDDEIWKVPGDNYIQTGDSLIFHNFSLSHNDQLLSIQNVNSEQTTLLFKNFQLETLSKLIEKDSSFVKGEMNGRLDFIKRNNRNSFTSNLNINSFHYKSVPVGDIQLKADNLTEDQFTTFLDISGNGNELTLKGTYDTKREIPVMNFNLDIPVLSMKLVAALSAGQMSNASGNVKGKFKMTGTTKAPDINGELIFENAAFHSTFVNNYFLLKNEKVTVTPAEISFSSFTILDSTHHAAELNGKISHNRFSNMEFKLDLRSEEFLALNTTEKDNEMYFGKIILDSRIRIRGNASLPKVSIRAKLLKGSNMAVAIPQAKINDDKGEGVVTFIDPRQTINPILTREQNENKSSSKLRGLDISANLEVDRNSSLKILIDPKSGDSLSIKGDATLSFAIDPSGKISLTGTYAVNEGKYHVSLEDLIKKDFKITSGSTITWNGDPLDADVKIDAVYEIKTSPADLVAGQISGLSEQEKNTYKQKLPFNVILHMTGPLLKPIIKFEIDLPAKYRGAMGGTVYARINQLNTDESQLNKQVFALLVLGRFVQEDPLASSGGGGGFSSAARTSVSKFLSQQLNKFTEQYIKGVELNFELQSYDDYSTGTAETRTELAVGVKKEFLNERMSISVGGNVDLSDKSTNSNNTELASDVTIEYKLTEDGVYRLKGFRQNQYEDVIEGEINVTGVGLIYTRDFNIWKDLFTKRPQGDEIVVPLRSE